jgi:hypothetical protein
MVRSHTGMSLAGAGGGGFLVLITRRAHAHAAVAAVLATEIASGGATLHTAAVDMDGMQIEWLKQ